ncbi:hypothetical protein JW879_07000 [candidate division WOR-3 bacterium]|nr:hypothetical protein [candidate division WOR-3 bacterium]
MLEMAGVLPRDQNGKLPNVFVCEDIESKAWEISKLLKPPIQEAIIPANLEDLLTFEDDEYTKNTPIGTFEQDKVKRLRLQLKERHERFKKYLPFDIVNFDPCGSVLEKALEVNRLYLSLEKLFEFQKKTDIFLLFVTTNISKIHIAVEKKFEKDYSENLKKHLDLKEVINKQLGGIEFRKIPEVYKKSICFVKSIIIPIARKTGWYCEHKGIIIYENPDKTKMLASAVLCTSVKSTQNESVYINDLIGVIKGKVSYHSYAEALKDKPLKDDLEKIKKYREQIRKN